MHPVKVRVTDGIASDEYTFDVVVLRDENPPEVTLQAPTQPIERGKTTLLRVTATDDVGVFERRLTVNGQLIALNSEGVAYYSFPAAGEYVLAATAFDAAGNTATASKMISVFDPANLDLPQVAFVGSLGVVTARQAIYATITDRFEPMRGGGLRQWSLDLLNGGGDLIRNLAHDGDATSSVRLPDLQIQALAYLDPTDLPNGPYKLRLTATDLDTPSHTVTVDKVVDVQTPIKLGNLSQTFVDLQTRVNGIPITISRHYDTADVGYRGDFGPGWRLSAVDYRLQTDANPVPVKNPKDLQTYKDGTRVTITLPDGRTEGFTFQPRTQTIYSDQITVYLPAFVPDEGNTTQLSLPQISLDKKNEYYEGVGINAINHQVIVGYNPASDYFRHKFELTTPDGLVYEINAVTGRVVGIHDRQNHRVKVVYDGPVNYLTLGAIVADVPQYDPNHNRGIFIETGNYGRIKNIYPDNFEYTRYLSTPGAPVPDAIEYKYDDLTGDLIGVKDREDHETTYEYYPEGLYPPHYLKSITDATRRKAVEVEYYPRVDPAIDPDAALLGGRVKSVADASSAKTNFTYDIAAGTQEIHAPGDTSVRTTLNAAGLPAREETYTTDAVTGTETVLRTVVRTFDANRRPLSETLVLGLEDGPTGPVAGDLKDLTTKYAYIPDDARFGIRAGKLASVTNPAGEVTSFNYSDLGQVIAVVGSGSATTAYYDKLGQLAYTQAPGGSVSFYQYDSFGHVVSATTGVKADGSLLTQLQDLALAVKPYDPAQGYQLPYLLPAPAGTTQTRFEYYDRGSGNPAAQYFPGDLKAVTDPSGVVTRFTNYDLAGNLKSSEWTWKNPANPLQAPQTFTTENDYDKNGRLQSTATPQSSSNQKSLSSTEYDDAGRVLSTSTLAAGRPASEARVTHYRYDLRGLTIETTSPDGLVSRTVYDALGRVSYSEDPHLPRTNDTLPLANYLPGQVAGGAHTTYDVLGRVHTTERYAQLVVRVFAPDTAEPELLASELVAANGRLAQSENVYHPAGWLEEVREADGGGAVYRTSHYRYDAAGRIIESQITADGQTQQTRSEYDRTTGRRTSQSVLRDVAAGVEQWQTTRYEYDAAGNVAFTVFDNDGFDDTSPANQDSFVFTAYDHRGLRISQTDQLPLALRYDGAGRERTADWDAFTTKYHYDTQGRLDRVELPPVDDPQDNSTDLVRPTYEYGYDAYGNLKTIRDALGRETTQTFDAFGRQLTRTLPDNGDGITRTETWTYLPDGSLDTHTDFKGQTTKTVYDSLGRIDVLEYFDVGRNLATDPANQSVDYDYNSLGRMVSVFETGDVNRSTTYGHDSLGRVNEIVTPEGTLVYDYDAATGQLTQIATAHSDVRYDYDHFGRLWHVTVLMQDGATLASPQVTTYSYTISGQVESEELPNGLETVYTYDGLDRLDTKTTTRVSDSTVISSFDYDRRADGRISHAVETIRNPAGTDETTVIDYVYDQLGRLTRETHDGPTAAEDFTADYLLDLVGNRLRKTTARNATVETIDYDYNELDQLIEELTRLDGVTQSIYESLYDLNGAQTLRERMDGPLDETVQTYDLRQRLASTTHREPNGSAQEVVTQAQYGYNHDGLRVRATETTAVDSGTPLVQQTAWLVDASNPTGYGQVWEMFSGSSLSSVIPASLAPTASYVYGHERISQHLLTVDSFYGTDHHGSVKQLWDAVGTVTDTYSYDAFGVPLHTTGTTANPFRYTGEQQDANGDVYLRRRILTPATGVFDSPDPFDGILSSPISLHNHGYGSFDPVNNTDPSGLFSLSEVSATTYIQAIGYALNFSNAVQHYGDAVEAFESGKTAQGVAFTLWTALDLFGVISPFVGPGAGGFATSGPVAAFATSLSAVGFRQGAAIGYLSTLGEILRSIDFGDSFTYSKGGTFEYQEGHGKWYSGAEGHNGGSDFQSRVTGKPFGWVYRLGGKDFDGFDKALNALIDAKNRFYGDKQFLLEIVKNGTTGAQELAANASRQIEIAQQYGLRVIWPVEGEKAARALHQMLSKERVGAEIISNVNTPAGRGVIEILPVGP